MSASITILPDVIMPNAALSAIASGKTRRYNARVQVDSGREVINTIWARSLREYTLALVPTLPDAWAALAAIFEVTDGGASGFLMQDPADNSVSAAPLSDLGGGVYQLLKRYTDTGSGRTKDRTITRPLASGFALTNGGTPVSSYTLDVTTGQVTIPGAPAVGGLAWSGSFYVPVHFQADEIDWDLVRAGPSATRLIAGPSVIVQEIPE